MNIDRPKEVKTLSTTGLWSLVAAATERAGALLPIQTREQWVEDQGVRFLVRVIDGLQHKPKARPVSGNPFLPFDPAMYVVDIAPHHIGLLNKFPVVANHLLIVTRDFQDQQTPLTADDFAALSQALESAATEGEALAFYNGGTLAGASQPHCHLQLIPLPLGPGDEPFPLASLLLEQATEGIYQAPRINFAHSAVRWQTALRTANCHSVHELYLEMLAQHRLWSPGAERAAAYNLLITRTWMWLVPRAREKFHGISLNALAFAGALLVRNDAELQLLVREGPWKALAHVTFPSAAHRAS